MVARLAEFLLCADKVFTLATDRPATVHHTGSIDTKWIEFYQDLLEADHGEDSIFAMKKIRLLPGLLAAQGIQSITFDGGNGALFEFRTSADPDVAVLR